MVRTLGAPGSPPAEIVDAMRASLTTDADQDLHRQRQVDATEEDDTGVRRRHGRVSSTRCPLCNPTPTARVSDFGVRWRSMERLP